MKKTKTFYSWENTPIELDLCDECIKRVISPIVKSLTKLGCKPRKVISLKKYEIHKIFRIITISPLGVWYKGRFLCFLEQRTCDIRFI